MVVRDVDEGKPAAETQGPEAVTVRRRLSRRSRRHRPRRIRGFRLVTKLMLVGLPLALVFVPWVSFTLFDKWEQFFVETRSDHQRRIAEDIATLFNGRHDLFDDLPTSPTGSDLVARPIARPVWLNARASEWGEEALVQRRFGAPGDASFTLSLGTHNDLLHAYLEITDDVRVYRSPEVLRLDNADQVRISLTETDGDQGRIAVTLSASGDTTAYRMDPDWEFAASGAPANEVRGFVRETDTGYAIEMRLPLSALGSRRFFGLSFVDVDDPASRVVRVVTSTAPSASESSNLVVVRSPELLKILAGLRYSGMRIRIVDAQGKERADRGSYRVDGRPAPSPDGLGRILIWMGAQRDGLSAIGDRVWEWATDKPWVAEGHSPDTQAVEDHVIGSALAGGPIALRRREGDVETILAGAPIRSVDETVIGMISVEQNIDDILLFQREAFDEIALVSVLSVVVLLLCLGLFAGRLTWRIRALRREVATAIDDYGRLQATVLTGGMAAADEIGDLARSVSNMLARLDQHNTFLQRMPRTLRHEINNPLNTVMTSLDQLAREVEDVEGSKYLDSARRGVLRIGAIVQNLADAASLEESLASEDLDVIDIHALMASYATNCRTMHKGHSFVFHSAPGPILANVADYRIEQMLDKLIDNAIDFHRANSPIKIQLDAHRDSLQITVANRGPMLPPDVANSLFESMVSRRASTSDLHFGLGLYVVRVIAEQHGGTVRAINLVDGSGVAVMVRLPLATVSSQPLQSVEQAAAGR